MIEITLYGRGGQGGVTLAKLIATTYFLHGKDVQAFGVYAAERSGAPVQAFVRIDDEEITNHNQIKTPDHVIVLDRTLIAPRILTGLKEDGWILLNTPEPPEAFSDMFSGRNVATIDATEIALAHGLGTKAVPIVNTTIVGAMGRLLDLPVDDVLAAIEDLQFGGANLTVARLAFDTVKQSHLAGQAVPVTPPADTGHVSSIRDDDVGGMPKIQTGSWASRQPQRQRLLPPCNDGCPAGNDVQGFIASISRENYTEALTTLLETSPFPATCGRVCPAPCMDACNRRHFDESVNIRELERAAAARGVRPTASRPTREESIGVVGSGPAGLSAAYHLARLGYRITLYEAGDELGGVMRTGIPSYRLPRDVLDSEINYILSHGVEVQTGKFVDKPALLAMSRSHAAVVVGTGLQHMGSLDLGHSEDGVVVQGIEFLDQSRLRPESLNDLDIVVVGGGNTAFDAARTAKRLGARTVRIVYRRARDQMPAIAEEIEEGIEEGVRLDELVMPVRLHHDGAGPVLTCMRMELGEPDASGRPRPVPVVSEDANFEICCDRVILALGQSADQSILPEGSELREGSELLGLSESPVFFCGDFANTEGTVTAAIGSGHRAALHVHRTIVGENLFPQDETRVVEHEHIVTHFFGKSPRREAPMIPAKFRTRSFTEVRRGFQTDPLHLDRENEATVEAQRCFSCGVCNECDRCLDFCPEGVVLRDSVDSYRFDFDYCKGCGVCASQCPRGVIYMSEL